MAPDTDWGSWPAMRLPAAEQALLKRARHQVISELPPFDNSHVQLVHADLKPVNSIWSSGRLLAIDFDDSGFAWPLFDLAASLTLFEADPGLAGYVEHWLTGFSAFVSLSDDDLASIPTFIMQRRLMILGWLHAHPDADSGVNLAETLAGTLDVADRYLSNRLL
jgi:Ser/Thr protein kinase RdoA (MazF antagonist)